YSTRKNIIIESFDVPKRWADQGLTGDVVARQLRDVLQKLENDGHHDIEMDRFVVHADPDPIPDVKIIGTGVGLRSLLDNARALFNRHSSREFILTSNSDRPLESVEVTLRVSRNGGLGQTLVLRGPFDDPRSLATAAAEA